MGFLIGSRVSEVELNALGWKPFFQQAALQYPQSLHARRVVAVHRSGLSVLPGDDRQIPMAGKWFLQQAQERPTVGDWLMVNPDDQSIEAILPRSSWCIECVCDRETTSWANTPQQACKRIH